MFIRIPSADFAQEPVHEATGSARRVRGAGLPDGRGRASSGAGTSVVGHSHAVPHPPARCASSVFVRGGVLAGKVRAAEGVARRGRRVWGSLLTLAVLAAGLPGVLAEDGAKPRAYLHFRAGEISPQWGVDDHYGLSLGYNFNRILGVEFAADFFERDLDFDGLGGIGEEAVSSFIPQLRVRYPLLKDRLVPYVVMGAGPAVLQFNDRKPDGFGRVIDADVTRAGFVVGGGLEYFLADNIAVGFEGKYLWMDEVDVMVDGVAYPKDLSSFMGALSLRVYFSENYPRPLVEEAPPSPSRLYFGIQYGGAVLTDDRITSNVKLDAEASAWGGLFNQVGGLRLGADLGSNWGVDFALDVTEGNVVVDDIGTVGEYSLYPALIQLRLRQPLGRGRWVPYFLAGGGIMYGEFNDKKEPGQGLKLDAKGVYPALGVGGGIEYFVARNFAMNLETRWIYSWDHAFTVGTGPEEKGDLSVFQAQLGFRLYLLELGKNRWRSEG